MQLGAKSGAGNEEATCKEVCTREVVARISQEIRRWLTSRRLASDAFFGDDATTHAFWREVDAKAHACKRQWQEVHIGNSFHLL